MVLITNLMSKEKPLLLHECILPGCNIDFLEGVNGGWKWWGDGKQKKGGCATDNRRGGFSWISDLNCISEWIEFVMRKLDLRSLPRWTATYQTKRTSWAKSDGLHQTNKPGSRHSSLRLSRLSKRRVPKCFSRKLTMCGMKNGQLQYQPKGKSEMLREVPRRHLLSSVNLTIV